MNGYRLIAALTVCIAMLVASPATVAQQTISGTSAGLNLACAPPVGEELRCDYRVASPAPPLGASARVGSIVLAPPQFAVQSTRTEPVALLLMVSEPMLASAARRPRIVDDVRRLLARSEPHHRFGLATFGGSVKILAPIGSSSERVVAALSQTPATPGQSLLYRSTVVAAGQLASASAKRKALVIVSGGASDDQQMDHLQAVREARIRGVVVYAIGYPGEAPGSGLERLRRLSEQTGGTLIAANAAGTIRDQQLDRPFAGMDNTGALSVNLRAARGQIPAGEHLVSITLETASGAVTAATPVYFPGLSADLESPRTIEVAPAAGPPAAPSTVVGAPAPRVLRAAQRDARDSVMVWILAVAALVLVVVLAVLVVRLVLSRRRDRAPSPESRTRTSGHVGAGEAFVVMSDGDMLSRPVSVPSFRIGRMGNNDLVLDDPSVSRHHAEIRRARDGSFSITDLDSMNGIYVNGRRVRDCALADGDELEVGDVRLGFELRADDPLDRDSTAMIDTASVGAPGRSS